MDRKEMIEKFRDIVGAGYADGIVVTFKWYARTYILSNIFFDPFFNDVFFRQETYMGNDDYDKTTVTDLNTPFMSAFLENLIKAIKIDRNMF